jgi:LDH2 family malate/lactate/ureidoglycolate dehydrogenase
VSGATQRFDERALRLFAETVLARVGARAAAARVVAASLLESDRRGVRTHGLVRLPSYCADVREGRIDAAAEPVVVLDHGPVATVDGRGGVGAVTGAAGMGEAISRARDHGVGLVTTRGGNHFGAAAFYALRAVEHGLVGISATSTPAVMAPWGGAEARLGNNPLAVAAPTAPDAPPFVLDLAQSAVSRGRIKLAELAGEAIPVGWALDGSGRATTDPAAALAGALLPFGGYKGYGLALAVEVLTSVLAGGDLGPELVNASLTGSASSGSATRIGTVGGLHVAIDPERFVGRAAFVERMARLAAIVTGAPPADGFDEVLLPGEPESRAAAAADAHGVELDHGTIAGLRELAAAVGLQPPAPRA